MTFGRRRRDDFVTGGGSYHAPPGAPVRRRTDSADILSEVSETYFQKGFGLKAQVGPVLAQSYHSDVVNRIRELRSSVQAGDLKLKLAKEFGLANSLDCRSDTELLVGEMTNWRVQRVTLKR